MVLGLFMFCVCGTSCLFVGTWLCWVWYCFLVSLCLFNYFGVWVVFWSNCLCSFVVLSRTPFVLCSVSFFFLWFSPRHVPRWGYGVVGVVFFCISRLRALFWFLGRPHVIKSLGVLSSCVCLFFLVVSFCAEWFLWSCVLVWLFGFLSLCHSFLLYFRFGWVVLFWCLGFNELCWLRLVVMLGWILVCYLGSLSWLCWFVLFLYVLMLIDCILSGVFACCLVAVVLCSDAECLEFSGLECTDGNVLFGGGASL